LNSLVSGFGAGNKHLRGSAAKGSFSDVGSLQMGWTCVGRALIDEPEHFDENHGHWISGP
jgi:hypothetical protein